MVFLYKRFGDKSNRLLQNMHFEAYCKENNIEYHNLEFYDMEDFYGIKDKYSFKKIPKIFLISRLKFPFGIIQVKSFIIFLYL